MSRMFNKKFVGILAVLVAVVASIAAVMPTTKLIAIVAPTATTTNAETVDVGFFDLTAFDGSATNVQARVVAIDLNTGKSKSFTLRAAFKRFAGTLDIVGNKVETVFETGDPVTGLWKATINHDDGTDRIFLSFTGADNTTIEWRGVMSIHLYQP